MLGGGVWLINLDPEYPSGKDVGNRRENLAPEYSEACVICISMKIYFPRTSFISICIQELLRIGAGYSGSESACTFRRKIPNVLLPEFWRPSVLQPLLSQSRSFTGLYQSIKTANSSSKASHSA